MCPFNNERAPCFKVYEDHFQCFGCGEHRDHTY
ncbi:CHC2 zinc finger domain-containing protein [Ruminococcus albus]